MSAYVKNYVKSCEDCQHRKALRQKRAGLLQPIPVTFPFHQVGIDILGPLPISNSKRYIVVCTDYFPKWAEAREISAANAKKKQTAKFFVEQILCLHGASEIILSDRGTNFLAAMVEEVFALAGTKHVTTTSYHPQTNGLTERVNGILTEMLSMYVNDAHSD